MNKEFRVKFSDAQQDILVSASAEDTFAAVAQQVRQRKGWSTTQHVRLICGGQEMYMDDPCSSASGSVLHCIPAAQERNRGPSNAGKTDRQQPVDWLEVIEPGTVLMWIFGCILTLLWLLFVLYAHMFDRTSIIMLCMMTVAFLIPCVLSYSPWLRMLANPASTMPPTRLQSSYYSAGPVGSAQWPGMLQGPAVPQYGSIVPPRPAARVRGPGTRQTEAS